MVQKGAMFGLDARIALSIFGALSVISGASLYSAIQNSKATSILVSLKEVSKAWEQYYLDTGNTIDGAGGDILKIQNLVSNIDSVSNWNGPYLSYESASNVSLVHPDYQYIHLFKALNTENWGDTVTWSSGGVNEVCVDSDVNCNIWIQFTKVPNTNFADIIDSQVDGGDGYSKGNFRVITNQSSPNYYILNIASVENL